MPTVFDCPSCGAEAIRTKILKNSNRATIQCGACGLKDEFGTTPSAKIIDAYCEFADRYYSQPVEEKPVEEKPVEKS